MLVDSATPWTVAPQAPLSMGFSRQGYWSGLPFPSPGGSSRSRDWTCISYLRRRVLDHWATWENPVGNLGVRHSWVFKCPSTRKWTSPCLRPLSVSWGWCAFKWGAVCEVLTMAGPQVSTAGGLFGERQGVEGCERQEIKGKPVSSCELAGGEDVLQKCHLFEKPSTKWNSGDFTSLSNAA